MRKSRLQRMYARAEALFAQGKLTDAILMYEQTLQLPFNRSIKRNILLRIKSNCFMHLADVKMQLSNYHIDTEAFGEEIIYLLHSAVGCVQEIKQQNQIDCLNHAECLIKLSFIHLGWHLLSDPIKNYFFNVRNAMHLAKQIQSDYNKLKNSFYLDSLSKLRKELVSFYAALTDDFLIKCCKQDINEESNQEILTEVEDFILFAIKLLREIPKEEYDDLLWQSRVTIERLMADFYGLIGNDEKEINYYKLVIEDCKKIKQLTEESLFFEDTTYTEYAKIWKITSHESNINYIVELNCKAIERLASLFTVVNDPMLIKALYCCIHNRFETIYELFSYNYGKNSFDAAVTKYAQQCYQYIFDNFHPQYINFFNEELLFHCLNFNRDMVSHVHALNTRLVLSLVCRADFPNKVLKSFLMSEQNIELFRAGIEPITLQTTAISNIGRSEEGLEVIAASPEVDTESAKIPDEQRKRRAFTYKEDQITLMSSRDSDKKRRTDPVAVASEINLGLVR